MPCLADFTLVEADGRQLPAVLDLPEDPIGIVLFAHGSGSGRLSPRNSYVAARLHDSGIATLLFDLLTEDEAEDQRHRFDVRLLARRLGCATRWARDDRRTCRLRIGYFGASTGAAAALAAAADDTQIAAVVSRGGRPDLVNPERLGRVGAPTLFLVGELDRRVMECNELAMERMPGQRRLCIVPDATHLFEEPGALEQVSERAGEWFSEHLRPCVADVP